MKKLILFKLFIFVTLSPLYGAGVITQFSKEIHGHCSGSNSLVIKKSLLELIASNGRSCEKTFTKKLLNSCGGLNCEQLLEVYSEVNEQNSGNVVGN